MSLTLSVQLPQIHNDVQSMDSMTNLKSGILKTQFYALSTSWYAIQIRCTMSSNS